jgi:radical SAM superfamily enzyme YgiQ (UPF0313 family)
MPDVVANRKTLVLVDPPYYRLYKPTYSLSRYPLSLGYLAAQVRRRMDWNVVVYNADFVPRSEPYQIRYLSGPGFASYLANLADVSAPIWPQAAAVISSYRPDVVGISCKSQTFASGLMIARHVRAANPAATIIVGGPHAAMVGKEILKHEEIDILIRGEGEATLIDLLAAIQAGGDLAAVAGIIFRRDGRIIETAARPLLEDLDILPYPHESAAASLHDYALYPREAFSHVFATRGCPYNCFFCGSRNIWSRRVRHRSPANVVGELEGRMAAGIRRVHFDDDTFGVRPDYIAELCGLIAQRCGDLEWSCELHVNLVNEETIGRMARAGCRSIQLGVESGNNEILAQIRKGFTIDRAIAAADTIRRHGIGVQAFFMVGFPQETEATLTDTVAAMRQIRGLLSYSIFTPYPGTEAFEYCRSRGLIGEDFDPARFNHQSPENCFCEHIEPVRFRALVARIEAMVDRNNAPGVLSRLFTIRQAVRNAWRNVAKKFQIANSKSQTNPKDQCASLTLR